jgi:hypothetical protein
MFEDQVSIRVTHPTGTGIPCSQPVRIGVPFQKGSVRFEQEIRVQSTCGDIVSTQIKSLDRWPDGSIRWALVEFWWQLSFDYEVVAEPANMPNDPKHGRHWILQSLNHCLHLVSSDEKQIATKVPLTIRLRIHEGGEFLGRVDTLEPIDRGPVRFSWSSKVTFSNASTTAPLVCELTFHSFANSGIVEYEFCIRNPQAMDHPGGNWDLGAKGAILIDELSINFEFAENSSEEKFSMSLQPEPQGEHIAATKELRIFQASSGGENWNSRNHVDRNGNVPLSFCGYEIMADGESHQGRRATPKVSIETGGMRYTAAYRDFWQNFPKSLTANANTKTLTIGLFPKEAGYPHELQGGEQKTHAFALEIVAVEEPSNIDWYLDPIHVSLTPEEYAKREALPYLTPRDPSSDARYESLVDLAIEGDDTFEIKREEIDEYGWRHFGDIYGDHEAVFHHGSEPLISHYNNQYDCTAGFASQYLRTGDVRWFDQMVAMADHAWDIDTYHTDADKLLYSGGLFWHTYHYADADTATHRSYPKRLRVSQSFEGGQDLAALGKTGEKLAKNYAIGGGPAAAHNYSTGWMVAYWLTGKDRYRTAAINAADYVMRIEDGRRTPFHWLTNSDTGYSTCSSDGYYGPGRAAANSTLALLTGHELTGDEKYLERAAKLMRRTVHPEQNLDALDLLNAELRWFYTMYLQALARFVEYKNLLGQRDSDFEYGVASLLHYANWMEQNERPTLSRPQELQYPTETWAAQDMRKWHVLACASKWCVSEEDSERLMAKAEFFYQHSLKTLDGFASKSLCRPIVLLLNFGWQREALLNSLRMANSQKKLKWPSYEVFIPQRQIAISRAKRILIALVFSVSLVLIAAIGWILWALFRSG